MANLPKIARGMKSLNEVATQIKNVALFYAPKKTGNLKRKMNQANRPANMIKVIQGKEKALITIKLNIAPDGAEYGKYWNSPNVSETVRKGKTPNVPRSIDYGRQALEDPQVKKELKEFFDEFSDEYVKAIIKEIRTLK
jgi:hypothetical protein